MYDKYYLAIVIIKQHSHEILKSDLVFLFVFSFLVIHMLCSQTIRRYLV